MHALDRHLRHSLPDGFQAMTTACVLLLAAASVGGVWDEFSSLGYTTWTTLCGSGVSGWNAVQLYVQLMPTSVLTMLAAGLAIVSRNAWSRRSREAAHASIAGHLGCLIAMPLALLLCTSAATRDFVRLQNVWAMLLVDLALAILLATIVHRLLRITVVPPAGVEPTTYRLGGGRSIH